MDAVDGTPPAVVITHVVSDDRVGWELGHVNLKEHAESNGACVRACVCVYVKEVNVS